MQKIITLFIATITSSCFGGYGTRTATREDEVAQMLAKLIEMNAAVTLVALSTSTACPSTPPRLGKPCCPPTPPGIGKCYQPQTSSIDLTDPFVL